MQSPTTLYNTGVVHVYWNYFFIFKNVMTILIRQRFCFKVDIDTVTGNHFHVFFNVC